MMMTWQVRLEEAEAQTGSPNPIDAIARAIDRGSTIEVPRTPIPLMTHSHPTNDPQPSH